MFSKIKDPKVEIAKTLGMVAARRKKIDESPATPININYGVNALAKALHPIGVEAIVKEIKDCTCNSKIIVFQSTSENKRFPYFKAGQFVTVSARIGESVVTRPYSVFSSPKQALEGILELGIQDAGFFSHFLTNDIKVGTKVIIGEPSGDFYYDNIRDKKNIVAIAGGSGITPFVSMTKSLLEGSDDFNLTIIYGVKTRNDLMYDFSKIKDPRIKVVVVLSNEEVKGYEHGFINGDILNKYIVQPSSIFMCGPDAMYKFVTKELVNLGYDIHSLRPEHNCVKNLKIDNPKTYKLTVHLRGEIYQIVAKEDETVLTALERAGLAVPSRCRSGYCGFCHTRLVNGEVYTPKEYDHRRIADHEFNYIHPCSCYPQSDVEIDVPPFDMLKRL